MRSAECFDVRYATYFNAHLFPAIAAVRLAQRLLPLPWSGERDKSVGGGAANNILQAVFAAERIWLPWASLPFGVSIFAAAHKKDDRLMCGIVGFTRPSHDADRLLAAMMDSIRYRGPDQDGIHIDDRIAVGHRRLSIIDLKGGKQPRVDSETGDVLVYNGEIYDYRRHAEDLRRDGVPLNDSSDTEVLFRLIQRHGVVAALERIEGMYAFAYRDGTSGRVTLARDRFGEKPLFYAVRERQLVFASEIKALRQHPALSAAGFDLTAIDQYLTFDYVPAPRTGYEDIRKLRPGHVAVFDGATVVETGYWQVPVSTGGHHPGSQPPTDLNAAVTTAEKILTDAIRSRLIADVPVGLFLSGGIDSALIAALASRIAPGITAYTIQLPGDGFDETPVAAEVAKQFDLTHVVRRVTGTEVDAALDRLDDLIDEPFADPSIVPTFLLCETARQGVKVAVGGDGADELFAGYINFQARRFASVMARLSPESIQRIARHFRYAAGVGPLYEPALPARTAVPGFRPAGGPAELSLDGAVRLGGARSVDELSDAPGVGLRTGG